MGTAKNLARIGIVTVSDRASQGEYEDRGGPAIKQYLSEVLISPWEVVARIVPDAARQAREKRDGHRFHATLVSHVFGKRLKHG